MIPEKPNTNCPVCSSPLRAAVLSMHELGASLAEISASTGIGAADIEHHLAQCLTVPAMGKDSDESLSGSDQQLNGLLQHAVESYHTAVLRGNEAAASSALSVRLRVLVELGNRARLRSEQQIASGELSMDVPNWPECEKQRFRDFLDHIVNTAEATAKERKRARRAQQRKAQRASAKLAQAAIPDAVPTPAESESVQ